MKKILVLDDVPEICRLIKLILEKDTRFSVITFTTGQDALEHVRDNRIDLAIIDIKLARMNGIDAFRHMKALQPDLRAIVLTGYPTIETARDSMEAGISEYCIKPLEKEMLVKSVTRLLFREEGSEQPL
jgi:DNA-binding NtrC family response regulator